jgi:hypothetical protein
MTTIWMTMAPPKDGNGWGSGLPMGMTLLAGRTFAVLAMSQ